VNKDKALKLALEALEYWDVHGKLHQPTEEAITAIKKALAQPEQEPVAIEHCLWAINGNTPCPHTTPPQRTWVGLTDEEVITAFETNGHKVTIRPQDVFAVASLARAVEAKLKEKNHD
jgi:hypothetical protein